MATQLTQTTKDQLYRFFAVAFDAAPGVTYMSQLVEAATVGNMTIQQIINEFTTKVEFTSVYPNFLLPEEFAHKLVETVVGSSASTDAKTEVKAQVVSALQSGMSRGDVIYKIFENLANKPAGDVMANTAKQLANQVAVAKYYTEVQAKDSTDMTVLRAVLANVTHTTDTSTTAAIEAAIAAVPVAGQTFMLTTGADISGVIKGDAGTTSTAGNDTFRGAVGTLTGADDLDGGAGTDALYYTFDTATTAGSMPGANIRGIENFFIREVGGTAGSYDFGSVTNEVQVWSDRSTDPVTFDKLGTGTTVGLNGDGSTVLGNVSFQMATASDAVSIAIANGVGATGTAPTITEVGSDGTATSATINSTGAANVVGTVDLANSSLTSVTINAATNLKGDLLSQATDQVGTDGVVTISGAATTVELTAALDDTIKTINASGLTAGGVKATLGTGTTTYTGGAGVDTIVLNTGITSANFGAGNDVVTTAAVNTTTAGAVSGGDGTDLLVVTNAAHVDTAAKAAPYTSFETLRNQGATDLDVSLLSGVTTVELDGANAGATKLTAAQAASIKVMQSNATNTISLTTATGTADVLGLTLQNSTAATAVDVTALTVTGFETLNVVSSSGTKAGGTGTGNDLAFAAAGDVTAINVSGEYDLTIAAASLTKAVTVTSTQSGTAALYASGNFVTGSTITGSGGADAFIAGTGFATYNGGAGNDTFTATAAQLNTGANYNVISGGDGTDTLNIIGAASLTIVDNSLSKITGVENIVIATTVDNNQTISTGGWFDAAFKANGVDLTTTTAKGTVTIDMTSFTGAAKLNVTTVGTTGTEGQIIIQTGTAGGADDITVSAASAGGAGSVKTYAGNDKITTASTEAFDITAGTGNDTITLGSTGIEIINFESTASSNGMDTITGFEFGGGKDVLQFKNFVGAAEAETLGGTIAGSVDASAKNVLTLTDIQDLTASNFGGTASATVIKTAASQKLVVIADKAADLDAIQNIYYVTTDASNVATVTLVGTINEGTFHSDNILTA